MFRCLYSILSHGIRIQFFCLYQKKGENAIHSINANLFLLEQKIRNRLIYTIKTSMNNSIGQ